MSIVTSNKHHVHQSGHRQVTRTRSLHEKVTSFCVTTIRLSTRNCKAPLHASSRLAQDQNPLHEKVASFCVTRIRLLTRNCKALLHASYRLAQDQNPSHEKVVSF
jgi:hypothetical protein